MRGGSSKGVYFKAEDLPADPEKLTEILLLAIEGTLHGDSRQINGLGGAHSLTSKVAIVSKSNLPGIDLDYYFIQVVVGKSKISTVQTCGNLLAGVVPFAIETGMLTANDPETKAVVRLVNTGSLCEIIVQTPHRQIQYRGNTKIDGVPDSAAPIVCNYLKTEGSTCGHLLPTGNKIDTILGVSVTCLDNGMPVVIMKASDFGLTGNESIQALENNASLKSKLESIRLQAGKMMNLGDVTNLTIPKMCLISPPMQDGVINTRMFIPHTVHDAIGVLAAVSVATACILPDCITSGVTGNINSNLISVEHPTGECTVQLDYSILDGNLILHASGVVRTARCISRGEWYPPG